MNPFRLFSKRQDVDAAERRVQELRDLVIDRVDGVDRPATGRNFLLAKSADAAPAESTEKRSIFRDVFRRGDVRGAHGYVEEVWDGEGEPVSKGDVRGADTGADAMGRAYDDQAYNALGGLNQHQPDVDPIPAAGSGPTLETDTRGLANKPQRFPVRTGGRLVSPMQPYENKELGEAGDAPVRVGESWVMSPRNSGMVEPLDFKKPEPATVVKARRGIFASLLGRRNDSADSFLG